MRPFDRFIKAMLGNLDSTGLMWARVGLVVLIVAAAMSWGFGAEVSWKHAAFLACLTFVAAFGPEAAHRAFTSGKTTAGIVIALVCAPLLLIEFYSHAGYTAGLRGHNIETASVQNVRYDDGRNTVVDLRAKAAEYEARLKRLDAEMAALVNTKVSGWAVSVRPSSPEELDGQIAAKQLEVDNEAKRTRCGPKCEARTNELAHLKALRAKAVEIATNSALHAATLSSLAEARNTSANIRHTSSPVVHQNQFLAKAVTLVSTGSLEPTPQVQAAAEQSANLAMAIAGTGLPAFCLFIAGLYRRPDDETEEIGRAADDKGRLHSLGQPNPAPAQPTKTTTQLVPVPETRVIKTTITDRAWAEAWESAMRQSRLAA